MIERGKRLILRLLSGNKCVDVTRPLLVEIGDNCTILENFLLLTHDNITYEKHGKRPTVEQMYEEFSLWMEGDEDDHRLKFSVAQQTAGYHDIWKKEHKAPFKSFDEFVDKALEDLL
ncbi:hypothetical protein [Bacteroides faecium]|uniref:Uncharacterized protein n=1 Tax=Bacteroides faecium TaxID=2715212 RepID=A0A6H0KQN6_9BACE|nr:hypothetical protein [Bacteroides faecium]QIU95509.1 hypothetical protein BacF7301_15715 [Bacteroides faecium]